MTFVGRFSRDSLLVDRAWVRIGVWPASAYTPAVARNLRRSLERLTATQNRLMGGPPYDVYTVFFAAVPTQSSLAAAWSTATPTSTSLPAPAFADEAGNPAGS
jgi:hypothetical protein